jgi:hypothetical protein
MEFKDQEQFNNKIEKEKKKWKGIIIICIVAILGGAWLVVNDSQASYGYCDDFKEGYVDGWCSRQKYMCRLPTFTPRCYAGDYQSAREAYHVGYDMGRRDG